MGGIKEKVLAAHRAGMKRVILPEANRADLEELPNQVRDELQFVCSSGVCRAGCDGSDSTFGQSLY